MNYRTSLMPIALCGALALVLACKKSSPPAAVSPEPELSSAPANDEAATSDVDPPWGTVLTILFSGNSHGAFDLEHG